MRIRQSRLNSLCLALAAGIALLALGAGLSVLHADYAPSAPARAGVDPGLVIHPRTTHFHTVLPGDVILMGSLAPTIPGENTIHLVLDQPAHDTTGSSHITLVATMPGMSMVPARATLLPRAHSYAGAMNLPMFGRYRLRIAVTTAGRTREGTVTLNLPLPQG